MYFRLGMSHDGSGNACANDKNIMSSLAASGPDAFKWSQCSADALKRALGYVHRITRACLMSFVEPNSVTTVKE